MSLEGRNECFVLSRGHCPEPHVQKSSSLLLVLFLTKVQHGLEILEQLKVGLDLLLTAMEAKRNWLWQTCFKMHVADVACRSTCYLIHSALITVFK